MKTKHTKHQELTIQAIEAIQAVHSDDSVGLESTLESLIELQDEVDTLVMAVREDIKRAGE